MDYAALEKERKLERKMMNTGILAAFSGGIGLAIYVMQSIVGGMAPDKGMNALIDDVCLLLVAYTGVILAVFIVRRKALLKVNFVMLYIILPAILLKLFSAYL